ncbi:ecto-ADP-ribosyltransferase 4 [Nelusetta ayraudi]|uniref:ecto-ADP-ribosyltransferase 4 n=1 Tax=Nelusetta ayraudi TaxID=303726 RepID=UPI003F6E4AD5
MWGQGKLLLAAAIIMAFVSKATAINPQQIDMGPHALVHTYVGCRDEAVKKFIQSGLLQQELNKSADFKEVWTKSKGCSKEIPERLKEHSTAIKVFLEETDAFLKNFSNAVEKLSVNAATYEDQFHFKSLYFLLMDLMTQVPQNKCRTVFMFADKGYSLINGSSVRFGSFVKASTNTKGLMDLDSSTVLNITSCFFVGSNVCNNKDDLVILSPAEVFTVEDIKHIKDQDDDYTMIVLNHQSVDTSQDCSTFSRSPADVSTQRLVLVLGALFLLYL